MTASFSRVNPQQPRATQRPRATHRPLRLPQAQTSRARCGWKTPPATCPLNGWQKNNVAVLPIKAAVDDWELLDTHNEFDAMEFFRKDLAARGARASTTPLSSAETREFIQSNLTDSIAYVLRVTIAAGRSKIYMNSLSAMHALTAAHNRVRRGIGNRAPFKTWVVDSETGFTGQGVMAFEANRQLNAGISAPRVAALMEQIRHQLHTFMVPKDLFYLYKRARKRRQIAVVAVVQRGPYTRRQTGDSRARWRDRTGDENSRPSRCAGACVGHGSTSRKAWRHGVCGVREQRRKFRGRSHHDRVSRLARHLQVAQG